MTPLPALGVEIMLQHLWQILGTLVVVIVYLLVSRVTAPGLSRSADEGGFKEAAGERASGAARLLARIFCGLTLLII
ncbi:MAG: hypothetical protein AAGI72_06835 [Pseudomonadota bacterium]